MGRLSLNTRRNFARGLSRFDDRYIGRRNHTNVSGSGNRATLTTALAGANNDLTLTAKNTGTGGNAITLTISATNTNSALTTSLTGANNDLVFTSTVLGEHGSKTSVQYVVAGLSTPLTVTTDANTDPKAIIVNVATDGAGAATSTSGQIATAIAANAATAALVTVANSGGDTGAGVVTAMAKTYLSGTTPAATVGVSTNAITVTTTNARVHRVVNAINTTAASSALVWAQVAAGNDGTGAVVSGGPLSLTGAV